MTFEPFQKVLVRDEDMDYWGIDFFEQYAETLERPYVCLTNSYKQCLPYSAETGHLLGTPSSPTEPEFKFGDRVEVSDDQENWFTAIFYRIRTHCRARFFVLRPTGTGSWPYCRKANW